MRGFDMVKRSPAERARHARAAAAVEEPTTTSREIVTETVVVHPTTTTTPKPAATTTTPALVKPTVITTPAVVKGTTTTSTLPSTTTSTTPTTTLPKTTSTSTTPTSTSTSSSTTIATTSRVLTTSPTTTHSSSTLIAPTPSNASDSSSTTPQQSGGLSGAATGGIVAASVIAALALLIFAIRKTFIQRRKRKRNTWGAGMYPEYTDKVNTLDVPPPLPEKPLTPMTATSFVGGPSPRTPVWAAPRPESIVRSPIGAPMGNMGNAYPQQLAPPQMQGYPEQNSHFVTPPPMSYNNPIDDVYGALSPAPSSLMPGGSMASIAPPVRSVSPAVEMALVRVVYIPSLPDELSVSVGETVRVVKAFDDGWALCSNVRGEQGVVPLECLDRNASPVNANSHMQLSMAQSGSSVGHGQDNGSDWRNMKRISSLSTQQPHY